jgi:glycosyltransferase involved in cell wall biosynthesis
VPWKVTKAFQAMSRISLIIPCYRDSSTLARAIESVYAQTLSVDELIVVNDCSPETEEIERVLQGYRDVVYVKNPMNIGLAATRNKGISVATGDIISFLDADDELHPQKLELQYPFVGEGSVVACKVERVVNGEKVGLWKRYKRVDAKPFQGARRLIYRNTITGASLMARKSLLLKVGGYDNDLRSCEDFDLWLRLVKENVDIFNIKLPLYRYYFNKDGLSQNYLGISNWETQVLLKHFRREGVVLIDSNWAARVWAFYILKKMTRFEVCKDERLAKLIDANLDELANFPFFSKILRLIKVSRLLKVYAWFVTLH